MRKRVIITSDVHYCGRDWCGVDKDRRMEQFVVKLQSEYERDPYEMILILGDVSLDFWKWNEKGSYLTQGRAYTGEFIETYCSRFPVPFYLIAGNHEQYGEEAWQKLTGFSRQFDVQLGNFVFVLLDTYAGGLDPTEHHDGVYTGIDAAYLEERLACYPDKKIILCSHYFDFSRESEEAKQLVCDDRILCLFCGHTHKCNVVTLPEELDGKKLIFTGNYGAEIPDRCMWGFRDLVLTDNALTSAYFTATNTLSFKGETYSTGDTTCDEVTVTF